MIKNYYGEKYAFEYAFLLHYQAYLWVPSILGLLLTAYQVILFFKTGDLSYALDSNLNAIYGLFITLWATVFVESWKRK